MSKNHKPMNDLNSLKKALQVPAVELPAELIRQLEEKANDLVPGISDDAAAIEEAKELRAEAFRLIAEAKRIQAEISDAVKKLKLMRPTWEDAELLHTRRWQAVRASVRKTSGPQTLYAKKEAAAPEAKADIQAEIVSLVESLAEYAMSKAFAAEEAEFAKLESDLNALQAMKDDLEVQAKRAGDDARAKFNEADELLRKRGLLAVEASHD